MNLGYDILKDNGKISAELSVVQIGDATSMIVEEIELPIKGKKEDIEKILLSNGFEIFYKVLTITSYYLPIDKSSEKHNILKERCKRIRYAEPMTKFKNEWQNYEHWIKNYDIEECRKEEYEIFKQGFKKIYTDEKTDWVYKKIDEEKMYFQIQDIRDDCLIIAYDNEKYYELDSIEQRKRLINDVEKYGIELLDKLNIDRFKLIGKVLTIEEIIEKMKDTLYRLNNHICES